MIRSISNTGTAAAKLATLLVVSLGLFSPVRSAVPSVAGDVSSTPVSAGRWVSTEGPSIELIGHTATRLLDGKMLVVSGSRYPYDVPSFAELYDPASGSWRSAGQLGTARDWGHTATLLLNGQVLVAGGRGEVSELYDPDTGNWTRSGNMAGSASLLVATLLRDGRVLATGSFRDSRNRFHSAEIYDPVSGTWSVTGDLVEPRILNTMTLLQDGTVLVAGGYDNPFGGNQYPTNSAEIFDPERGRWETVSPLSQARYSHTATLLQDGRVLIAGGGGGDSVGTVHDFAEIPLATWELFDPASGNWDRVGELPESRIGHTATLLPDAQLLILGGESLTRTPRGGYLSVLGNTALYDPSHLEWRRTADLNQARYHHTATLLLDGSVLVVGGLGPGLTQINSAERYVPAPAIDSRFTGSWYDPAQPGHGVFIQVLPEDRFLAWWFTFNPAGTQQAWFGGVGTYSGVTATIPQMTQSSGGRWIPNFNPAQVVNNAWGSLSFEFSDLDHGRVDFNSVAGYGSGSMNLTRLTRPAAPDANGTSAGGAAISPAFTGAWYDPAQAGHGLFVEVLPDRRLLAWWFSFDPAGTQQAWFGGVGTYSGNTATIAQVVQPAGGRWIPNFNPQQVTNNPWGTLTLSFSDCAHGTAQFSSSRGYGTGSMNLARLTVPMGFACPR